MKCFRCQAENPPGMRFCGQCAEPLAAACPSCGSANPPGNRFCGQCAAPLTAATGPRLVSPDAYTPKHLAEKILLSKAALEGERKQVTVLFADLKGSMELLADRDPEEARKLLDPVLEVMMEAVHHYEGTVNQVMGDGIMALFGAPVAHEDHAVRACYAALRMQRRVTLYADEIQRAGGTPVQIRAGLNSGEVVVRAIGSDLHMDYTAVGQTTHLAARMEQMAKPGSALVTGDTLKLAEGYIEVRALGAVPVKGLETPTPVYELTGTVRTRSRLQASAARGLTHFVGRGSELQQLAHARERAAAGRGQAVAIVGEAGVGKSRLLWEFMQSLRTPGWLVLEGTAVSYGKATPYLPVLELLKAYCRIQERDHPREIRERVAGKLVTLDRALEPLLTPLLALLGVPVDDATWEALDPTQRRQRTLDAVKGLLLRESRVQPLLLLFEDLHWNDTETQAVLDILVESLPTARVLLLVTYRPEYQHRWSSKTYYRQLHVDPLLPEQAEKALEALLGTDPDLGRLKRLLIDRTEGNPFCLEESVRTLVETRALSGNRGAYTLARPIDAIQVPETVQAILAARIDRLLPEDKRLLQSAAVIGREVPFVLLQAIADLPDEELGRGLVRLQAAEFLYETRLFPDPEYTFKHALTQEIAYGSMLRDRRRGLHARLVVLMEGLYAERLGEHAERLGDHAVRGEELDRAVTHLAYAGTKAKSAAAFHEAAHHFGRALEALAHLPENRQASELRVDLLFQLHDALLPVAHYDRIRDVLREAEVLANGLDKRRLGRAYSHISHYAWVAEGDNRRAAEYAHRALTLARAEGSRPLEIVANFYLGQVGFSRGALRGAIAAFRRNCAMLPVGGILSPFEAFYAVVSRTWAAYPYSDLGAFAEGLDLAAEALAIADGTRNPVHLVSACIALGQLHLRSGDVRGAIDFGERGLAVRQASDLPQWFPMITGVLGPALVMAGQVDEGLELLRRGVAVHENKGIAGNRARHLVDLSDVSLSAGRVADAVAHADQALALARQREERGLEAHALRMLGEIASRRDSADRDVAQSHYERAGTLAAQLEMRPLVAHCHLGLGNLHRRTDKREEAQQHLATATAMYREMGMTYWVEKAKAETADLGK